MKDVKGRILETATRLFSKHGYRGIGVDAIAREADVSKVTMYRYFESREVMIMEVLKARMQAMEEGLKFAVAQKKAGRDRVRAIFRWYENWFGQPDFQGCIVVAALWEYKTDPAIVEMVAAQREMLFELIRETLLDVVHPSVLDQLSRQLLFLLYGAIIFAQTGRQGAAARDAWECASQLIDFVSQGRT